MASISLKVPTLIREVKIDGQRIYHIRPVFLTYPVTTNYRYDAALSIYKKEIKNIFKGFEVTRATLSHLLWYMFSPPLRHDFVPIYFKLDQYFVDGYINAVVFELKGLTFVLLPSIQNYMFISTTPLKQKKQLYVEIEQVTKRKLKELRNNLKSDFEIDNYLSNRKEFVKELEVKVYVSNGKFKFEVDDAFFFSHLNQTQEFNGAIEIEKVGQSLNGLFPTELRRAFLREKEVMQLHDTLFKTKNKHAIAIVGEIGVGRHTLVQEALYRYLSNYYSATKGRKQQLWQVDPNRIIAGMSIVGMWQKRFEAILEYVQHPVQEKDAFDSIIFDNPIALLRIGKSSQNSMTLSDVLKPYLETRQLQTIIIATPEEWKIVQEKDRRFADLFQVTRLQSPDFQTTAQMVLRQRREVEKANNCKFTIQAIHQLFDIQRTYLKQYVLPGGVMKLMNQLAVKYRSGYIDLPEVRAEFKSLFGLEEHIFEKSYQFEPNEVQDAIASKLIGQTEAVASITRAVHLIKAKLNVPTKPLSSYLFIGPTGVGKTQAAKVLCQYLLGSEDYLLRLDMNEYIDAFAVSRLIGDEMNPEGILTGKVRYRSFGVLLLDEIEKAHPTVRDLLLQVLDDGRLTDSLGRVVDFSNLIIIMTSNVGAQDINRQISTAASSNEQIVYRRAVERHFRPEFVNRIDKIVVFNPLEKEHILSIARLQIKELLQRDGFVRRTTILNVSQDTLEWVAERGYDKSMGGRALKRQIEKEITAISAAQLNEIQNELPIIFNIDYDKEKSELLPSIEPLVLNVGTTETLWHPELIEESRSIQFYNTLLQRVQFVEDDLRHYNDTQYLETTSNWQFYQLKDAAAELKDSITFTKLRSGIVEAPYDTPLYFKRIDFGNHPNIVNNSNNLLLTIRENYKYNDFEFERLQCPFINYQMDVLLLEVQHKSYFESSIDQITISFQSYLDGLGDNEINILFHQYKALLHALDVTFEIEPERRIIKAEGQAIHQILQVEHGIHLFYLNYQTPIPISVKVVNMNVPSPPSNQVIRAYDGTDTITDLRSGYIISNSLNTQEHKFLLLSSLMV